MTETADHVIIDLCLERDPDDEWLEGSGLLAGMVQARSDLAAGDLRLLYLAWLLGIQRADENDDDLDDKTEPPVPAGLGELSAPLEAIAEFLEIYEDLLAVAAEASPQAGEPQPDALAARVLTLPTTEKDTLLTMLASGQETQAQALLLRRFRDTAATADHSASARRAAELLEAADARMLERKRAEEERCREQQRRRAAAQAAAHVRRLDDLAAEGDAPWKRVDEMIAAKKTSEHDLAVSLLRDLRRSPSAKTKRSSSASASSASGSATGTGRPPGAPRQGEDAPDRGRKRVNTGEASEEEVDHPAIGHPGAVPGRRRTRRGDARPACHAVARALAD